MPTPPKKISRKKFLQKCAIGLIAGPTILTGLGTLAINNRKLIANPLLPPDGVNCVLSPSQPGGPFLLPPEFNRTDITEGITGHPMFLTVKVLDVATCEPIPNALVNIWHTNADGAYSSFDINQGNTSNEGDESWMRGYQVSDCNGDCEFITIFPGWYPGRVAHIHFDVHLNGNSTKVSQMYFPDETDDAVYQEIAPYSNRTDGINGGPLNPTNNTNDGLADDEYLDLLVCAATSLEYDADNNPLPIIANFTIGLDLSGLTLNNENCEGFPVELKAYLEGAYDSSTNNNGLMRSDLANLIPLTQVYNTAPYNYMGNETLNEIPSNMVDWVLVEARTGMPLPTGMGTSVLETKAGLLLEDGQIVGTDGTPLRFSLEEGEMIFFAIRHRNHLDVLSSIPIEAGSEMAYDFTTAIDQAWGPQQLKLAADGKALLYAGDFNHDGTIQTTDNDLWQQSPAVVNTYQPTDGNLDGVVQTTDYDTWFANKAKLGSGEIQF